MAAIAGALLLSLSINANGPDATGSERFDVGNSWRRPVASAQSNQKVAAGITAPIVRCSQRRQKRATNLSI
jgi:hypothetical protein